MSKEINLDDDDIFKDMGDDFGDFNTDEPKVPTGREAILEAPKTAIAGAANALFGEGKRRQLLAKAMPEEFSVALDAYDNLASEGIDIYRHAKDELTKTSRQLKNTVRQAMPVISPFLPKSVSDKVKEWSQPDFSMNGPNMDPTEAAVGAGMREAFGDGESPDQYVTEKLEQKVRDIKADSVHDIIAHIGSNIEEYTVYNRTVGNNWRKKMLEVNLRQYFALADLNKNTATANQKIVDALTSIVKNTALPDYAKEEFGEITKAMMKRKIIEKLSPLNFARNYFKILGNEARSKISEFFGGATDILSAAGDAGEMVSSVEGLDEMTDEQRRVKMGGSAARQLGASLANKYIRPKVDKGLSRFRKWSSENEKIMSPLLRTAAIMASLPDRANQYGMDPGYDGSEPEWVKKMLRVAGAVGPQGGSESVTMEQYDTSAIDVAAPFTKRTGVTINEIIPGLLARIDRSVRRLQDPSADLEVYDFATRTFKTMQGTAERINGVFKDKDRKDLQRKTTDDFVSYLEKAGDSKLSDDAKDKLRRIVQDRALNNKAFDVRDLGKSFDAYGAHYSDELMDFFNSMAADGQKADRATIQSATALQRIRSLTGRGQQMLTEHLDRYGAETLQRAGVLVEENGKLVIDPNFIPYLEDTSGPQPAPKGGGRRRRIGGGGSGGPVDDKPIIDAIQKLQESLPGTIEAAIIAANEKAGKSKPQRQTKTNKLLEEILEQLKTNNVHAKMDEVIAAIQEGGGGFRFGNPFKGSGAWFNRKFRQVSIAGKRMRRRVNKPAHSVFDFGKKHVSFGVFKNAKDTVFGAFNSIKAGILGNRNIYDEDGNLILSGRLLAAGVYYTKDGRQIKSLKDITGGIYNAEGEPIVTEEDMQAKIEKLRYWNGKGWKFLSSDLPGLIGSGVHKALSQASTFRGFINSKATQFAKYVYTWATTDEDVYTADNLNTPRLYNSLMRKGWYVSEVTGKVIRQVSDIDGPVITKHKEPIITAQELADPNFKLVGKNGKPIQGISSKLFGGAKLLGSAATGAVRWLWEKGKNIGHRVREAVGGKFDLPSIFGENGVLTKIFGNGNNKVVDRLDKIYELLQERLRGGSGGKTKSAAPNSDNDLMSRYRERERKRKEKAAADEPKGNTVKDKTLSMLTSIRDTLASGKEKLKKKFTLGGTASADNDGDGVRDNSFTDIFRRRKEAAAKRAADKAAAAGVTEKPKGMLGRLLGMLGPALLAGGEFLAKGFFKIAEKVLGPLVKMVFEKALSPVWKVITGAFEWGAGKIGAVMKGGWDLLKAGGTKVAEKVAGSMAEGGMLNKAAKFGGRILNAGKTFLGSAATRVLPFLAGAGEMVGGALASAGAAIGSVLTAPVVGTVAAVAAIGYIGYKLATRKVAEPLDQYRFAQYGTQDYHREDLDDVAKLRYLEANYIKYVAYDKDGIASIRGVDPKICDEIARGYGLNMDDEDQVKLWNAWLHGRFIPLFLLWCSRARQYAPSTEFKSIGDVKSVNPKDQLRIFDAVTLNREHPVFRITQGPFDDTEVISLDDLADLQKDLREEIEDLAKYTPTTKMAGEQKVGEGNLAADTAIENGDAVKGVVEKKGAVRQLVDRVLSSLGFNTEDDQPATASVSETKGVDVIGKATLKDGRVVSGQVDALVAIRMRAYGLYKLRADRIAQLYRLEDYLKEKLLKTKIEVTYRGNLEEDVAATAGFFGIPTNNEGQMRNYAAWFRIRFIPVFLNYVSAVNKFLPNGDPFTISVNGSTPQLYDIASAVIATRTTMDGNQVAVWQVPFTPWEQDTSVTEADVMKMVDANLRFLDKLRKDAIIAEQSEQEKINRRVNSAAANKEPRKTPYSPQGGGGDSMSGIFDANGNVRAGAVDPTTGQPSSFGGYDNSMGSMTEVGDRGSGSYADLRKNPAGDFNSVGKMLVEAAKLVGIDPGLLLTVGMMESGLDPKAGANSSSAKGLFQFLTSASMNTWGEQLGKYGNTYGIPENASVYDPWANAILGAQYLKDGAKRIISKIGRAATPTDVYMTHFMGPGGGPAFLKHLQDTPNRVAAVDFPKQAKANPGVFGTAGAPMTYAQVYAKLQDRAKSNFSYVRKFVSSDPNAKGPDPKKVAEAASKDQGNASAPQAVADATKSAMDKSAASKATAAANAVATPAGGSTAPAAAAANNAAAAKAADTANSVSANVAARNNVEAARITATAPDNSAATSAFAASRTIAKATGDIATQQLAVQQQMLTELQTLVSLAKQSGSLVQQGAVSKFAAMAPSSDKQSFQQPRGVIPSSN